MIPCSHIADIKKHPPLWLMVLFALCSTAFYLPYDGYCNKPAVQDEQVYTGTCKGGKTISYQRALSLLYPAVANYHLSVTMALAAADNHIHVLLRSAAEKCRHIQSFPPSLPVKMPTAEEALPLIS
ncbi:hypothetical protein [Chitinophaga flava]|uniref:Uncharacterized protein n=1 Tax=Chitinophaga flava TaxID=2259036 RepID=A0A365Y2T2_9BACT|nr:hypothetical protein [Chitinophaga flava]RBL92886.1 hypothetical protein DF182_10005 [Chitinophaga flava]